MITIAERRFPVRIRLGVPPEGFGQRHTNITAWLDENCGADGWAITPSGVRGVLNDAAIDDTDRKDFSVRDHLASVVPRARLADGGVRCAWPSAPD